jgi:hypothetical protein
MVTINNIIGLLGIDHYHGKPIFIKYYSIWVEEVFDGKVYLFLTNETNDPFQLHIMDIVRTTTLCEFQYIAATKSL